MDFMRSAGILLHPSSFPSEYGIGDFGKSAYDFIDFLESAGMKLWQILPLGPTSFGDSPYQSFSAFAGNPYFISPEMLVKDGLLNDDLLGELPVFSQSKVDYGQVSLFKTRLYKKAFEVFRNDIDAKRDAKFERFCEENSLWLEDYALFVSLKDYFIEKRKNEYESDGLKAFSVMATGLSETQCKEYYYGAVWSSWPQELVKRDCKALSKWRTTLETSIKYYKFLQFLFFSQWEELKKYANNKGIQIIGDIPIFVAYDSADVWAQPENYYMDEKGFPIIVAGVPPDYFSATGQLWGNPIYKWETHEKNDFSWWKERIKKTFDLVDIVRVDHFRGFEGYWAIPFGESTAINGRWQKGPANALFDAVKGALGDLAIIAEDLGIITEEVVALREKQKFPGMRVLQFAFDQSENNAYLPHNFDKHTVVYTGTHDNDTTLGWYEKASVVEQDAYRRYCNASGETPSWDLIRLAIASTAAYAIFPLQDVLSLGSEARMNTPSVAAGNWMWRYTPQMLKPEYAKSLRYLVTLFAR